MHGCVSDCSLQIDFVLDRVVIPVCIYFIFTTSLKADTIWNLHVKLRASLLWLMWDCYTSIFHRLLFIQLKKTNNEWSLYKSSQYNCIWSYDNIGIECNQCLLYIDGCWMFVRVTREMQIVLLYCANAHLGIAKSRKLFSNVSDNLCNWITSKLAVKCLFENMIFIFMNIKSLKYLLGYFLRHYCYICRQIIMSSWISKWIVRKPSFSIVQ